MLRVSTKNNIHIIEITADKLELEELKSALNLAMASQNYKIILDVSKIKDWPCSDETIVYLYEQCQFFKQRDGDIKIILPINIKAGQRKKFDELNIPTFIKDN